MELLIAASKLKDGSHIKHPKVNIYRGKKVVISSDYREQITTHAMGRTYRQTTAEIRLFTKETEGITHVR